MKINGPDLTGRLKELLERLRPDESEEAQGTSRSSSEEVGRTSGDRVDLSERARDLRILSESLESEPAVRRALVDSLREEIRTGRYTPDGRPIAEQLLSEVEPGDEVRADERKDDDVER